MKKIDTKLIPIPMWPTSDHKVKKAYSDGKLHAINHYNNEDPDPYWNDGVKSWAINPYAESRPAAYYSWIGGFMEQWADLVREDKEV